MRRLMFHCCAIDSSVLVTQYNTRPDGKNAKVTDMTSGRIMNILACSSSAGLGCKRYCRNMAPAMMMGRM